MKKKYILKANLYNTSKGISTWDEMSFDEKKESHLFAKTGDSVIWEAKTGLFTEGVKKKETKGLKPEWLEFKGVLKEDESALSHSKQVLKYKDNPVVSKIVEHFKDPKKVKLERIEGIGDVWHMDLSFSYDEKDPYQARENAKGKAYDIKRELEGILIKEFNLPSMSIQGVGCNDGRCKFSISFIYANRGNHKVNYEAKTNALVKFFLIETETETPQKDKPTERMLELEIKKWETLNKEIEGHEADFRKIIDSKLQGRDELEKKVFQMMDALSIKTKKVNFVIAKIKDDYTRTQKPGPKDTLAFALSKVNTSLKTTINNWVTTGTKTVDVPGSKTIEIDSSITQEGVGDSIKQGFKAFATSLKTWWNSAHAYLDSVKEFEAAAKQEGLTEGRTNQRVKNIQGDLSGHLTKKTGMSPDERAEWRQCIKDLMNKGKFDEGLKDEALKVFQSFNYWREHYQNKK